MDPASESGRDREKRIRALFNKLDTQHNGHLSLNTLMKGFQKIDHPLQSSPEVVHEIFSILDANNDNVVEYQEFRRFVLDTEINLLKIFMVADEDGDGMLNKNDIKKALASVKINASDDKINLFFEYMDNRNTGLITFDEWRNFLLFLPTNFNSSIQSIYDFFIDDLDLNSDGDVTLSADILQSLQYFLAGGLSGVVSRTCTAPFDRIKVFLIARTDIGVHNPNMPKPPLLHPNRRRLKPSDFKAVADNVKSAISSSQQFANGKIAEATTDMLEKSAVDSLKDAPKKLRHRSPLLEAATFLWRQGGIKAFYVGNGLNVIKVFPESAIKFGTFEASKKFLSYVEGVSDPTEISRVSTFLAGGMGGVAAQFTVYPIDTLKYRVQCESLSLRATLASEGKSMLWYTAKKMYAMNGIKTFYRGLLVGVGGIFPYAAIDLGTFSMMKKYYITREAIASGSEESDVKLGNMMVLSMGAFSGSIGATIVYPINLLRTRLQAQGTSAHPYVYSGFGDVFKQTVEREGYQGLFKGLFPNLAKVIPAVSISYLMYENLKRVMHLEGN